MIFPLGLRTQSELASDDVFLSLVARLQSEDLTRITKRLAQRKCIAIDVATFYKDQFLRFFALTSHLGVSLAPSTGIDLFWHEFILYTKQYHDFCDRTCGYFFHHEPFDDQTLESIVSNTESGERLIELHFAAKSPVSVERTSKCASPEVRHQA